MSFASWLSGKMDERHINQSDLADRLGITRGAINNLLTGRSKTPSADTIQKISDIFHTPVDEVYRAAGLLPSSNTRDKLTKELLYNLEQLDEDDRQNILVMIRALADAKRAKGKKTRESEARGSVA